MAPYGINNANSATDRVTPAAGGSILVSGDDALGCFEKTGELRWVFSFQRLREAVADNGTFAYPARQLPVLWCVFLGASSRVLYAIDIATGALRWSWSGARSVFESVTGGDGLVHVETTDFKHWALDIATGRVLWGVEFRRVSNCQTGIFNGVLVRPNIDGWIFALNATNGAFLWQSREPDVVQQLWEPDMPFRTFPAYPLGLAYISDTAGNVFAFDLRTGKVVWKVPANEGFSTKYNRRMNLELWGDNLIIQAQGFVAIQNGFNYGIMRAVNALTGEKLWLRDNVYPGMCGMTVSQGLLIYAAYIQPYSTGDMYGPGDVEFRNQLAAIREDGSEVWKFESSGKTCTGSLQQLDGVVVYLYNDVAAGSNHTLQLLTLPAVIREGAKTCAADVFSPALPPVEPKLPTPTMRPPAESGGAYCWRQTMAYKPLGSPATDGERVYIQDNAGLILAIDIESGEVVWKAFAGPGSEAMGYPTNVLVADGRLYLGTANTEVQVRDAGTGHLLWRRKSGTRPGQANWLPSFYGYPAYAHGIMYIGTPDAFINAFNATTGEEVWNYYIGVYRPDTVQYSAADNLVYAIGHDADAGVNDQQTALFMALDGSDGSVVWQRPIDSFVSESGAINIVNGYTVFATWEGEIRAYSVGRGGGDLLWTYIIGPDMIGQQESALLVDGKSLGLAGTDVVFWGDGDSNVTALRTADLTILWRISVMDIDLFPEMESLPQPYLWLQFTLSNGALYIPTSQGLFVVNATNGAPLWTDLRGRVNANVLVVERPGVGAQVIYGRYLSNVDSNVPSCRPDNPSAGGISTLATAEDVTTVKLPAASPAIAPMLTAASSPSPSPSPSLAPSPSPAAKPSPAASPAAPSASPVHTPAPAPTCPPCPARTNCSMPAPAPTAPTSASVSLGLTVVSVKLLKVDKSSQDHLEGAVSKLIDSKSVRVHVTSVEAVGSSSSGAVVVRFSLKASSSRALGAAVDDLQDAVLDGKLQAALGAKSVRVGALAATKVRSLVVTP
ncbi:hypothetical protein HXX76_014842 [Chlamydomonas incerta]|uniref:Pyrrolo-quinoline quinone repeat domain-containing protein n=1 Tax=Chlamydomonas incerta TaxID=51695 RepID=A0A835VP48_CHLIN|nr:hypothetical protein HXX76_014842 [Chlamydomonas incerta]|eukprot:KAG2424017.1 hypothetical protein HXX76_014842 [Chlamydomonas incerta]